MIRGIQMLYYGNSANVQDDCLVLNFTSAKEGYKKLDLIPPNSLGAISEYDFDVKYMNWIMSDDYRFSQMFQIIDALSAGRDVYIMIGNEGWSEMLIESLLKLIQQRYGYNALRVNCFDDLLYTTPSEFNKTYGLINLDMDNDRYAYYIEARRLGGWST